MSARFHLLGEVGATTGGQPVPIRHARVRCVLAVLAVDVNRPVSADTLVDRVFGEQLPRRPREAVYSYLSRLRVTLDDLPGVGLDRRSGGYVLRADPGSVDLHRFRELVARAAREDDRARAVTLAEALELWTGEALGGADSPWASSLRDSLAHEQLAVRLDAHDAGLRLGRHAELVVPLTALASARPLDERVAHQLIDALARSGQQAQALARYETLRRHLADELGVDPNQALRDLHQRLLSPAAVHAAPPVPRQLPLAPRHFQGRVRELEALSGALRCDLVLISAIRGAGGVGKTWLALHWAHRHADDYPDGQLYVNLRGFDLTMSPADPAVVLRGFLTSLGTAADGLPEDVDTLAAMYRSAIAGRAMLVVLDNAADADQVVPLLPGAASCRTLVTSRRALTGLVATHGAVPMRLDVLSDAEARDLLVARLGEREPEAIADIVRHCGGLPLALGIVAARAAVDHDLGLAAIAEELRLARLDALDAGDVSLRAALSWSHRALSEPAVVLFGLLGRAPAADLRTGAIDALADGAAANALAELEAAHLVIRTDADHYRMHDLVHLYASEQPSPGQEDALRRLVDYYLHTAHHADRLLDPGRPPYDIPETAVRAHRPSGEQDALSWFETEHTAMLAALRVATENGWHRHVWALASTFMTYHWRQGHRAEPIAVLSAAAAAAEAAGEPAIQARQLHALGHVYARAGLNEQAVEVLEQSAALSERLGDVTMQGHAHLVLARAWGQRDDYRLAKHHAALGLDLYQRADAPNLVALALNNMGWICGHIGEYEEALRHCQAALPLHRDAGHASGVGETLDSIGFIHEKRGARREAAAAYRESAGIFRELGHSYETAVTLRRLGTVLTEDGDHAGARQAWTEALRIFRGRGLDEADAVESQLTALPR